MLGLEIAIVIVLAAAALLVWIIAEARGIEKQAARALSAAALVEKRTAALDGIPTVNGILRGAIGTVLAIHGKADGLADGLGGPARPSGTTRAVKP